MTSHTYVMDYKFYGTFTFCAYFHATISHSRFSGFQSQLFHDFVLSFRPQHGQNMPSQLRKCSHRVHLGNPWAYIETLLVRFALYFWQTGLEQVMTPTPVFPRKCRLVLPCIGSPLSRLVFVQVVLSACRGRFCRLGLPCKARHRSGFCCKSRICSHSIFTITYPGVFKVFFVVL